MMMMMMMKSMSIYWSMSVLLIRGIQQHVIRSFFTHCSLSQCWTHCFSDNIFLRPHSLSLCMSQPASVSSLQSCTHLCHLNAVLITEVLQRRHAALPLPSWFLILSVMLHLGSNTPPLLFQPLIQNFNSHD